MDKRTIVKNVKWLGAVDWDRRLFDALVKLPEGTSYNAYLVQGSNATALIDTVEPQMRHELLNQLQDITSIDYLISNHAEQDHSGLIPELLQKYPKAKLLTSTKAQKMLTDLMEIPDNRLQIVGDGEALSLGDKTLRFIEMPWVHWPETMVTYLEEDKILFSCDFFGSHLATSDLYAQDERRVYQAAKLYYAQIMMPFAKPIEKHLERLAQLDIRLIAPSHGPIYKRPAFIIDAYSDWVKSPPRNHVVVPYVSMHGSTQKMVQHLVGALVSQGVTVDQIELSQADTGKLALALVDAATLVVGSPTVLGGLHPNVGYAALLVDSLRPKCRFTSLIGSYGWGGKAGQNLSALLSHLKTENLPPVLSCGQPRQSDFVALDKLAQIIASKHKELDLPNVSF